MNNYHFLLAALFCCSTQPMQTVVRGKQLPDGTVVVEGPRIIFPVYSGTIIRHEENSPFEAAQNACVQVAQGMKNKEIQYFTYAELPCRDGQRRTIAQTLESAARKLNPI